MNPTLSKLRTKDGSTTGLEYALRELALGRTATVRLYHKKALVERDLAWWPSGREDVGDVALTEKGRRLAAEL